MGIEVYALIWVAVMGGIGMAVGAHKGRIVAGLLWGTLLGVFGWLLVWLGPTHRTRERPRVRSRSFR